MKYNTHLLNVKSDYIFAATAEKVRRAKAAGKEITDLGIGDVKTPVFKGAASAMKKAVDDLTRAKTFVGYTPFSGLSSLKKPISDRFREYGAKISEDEIFVTDGSKGVVGWLPELLGDDAEITLVSPTYPAYFDNCLIRGLKVGFVRATKEDGFLPYPPFGKRTDAVYLCSPNNPTGAAMTAKTAKLWIDYALSHDALLIVDAAYSAFAEGEALRTFYSVKDADKCVIEVHSFSKSFCFTGVRCGFFVVPKGVGRYNAMTKRRQSTEFNGVSYPVQAGAATYFTPEGRAFVEKTVKKFKFSAQVIKNALKKKNLWYNISCHSPYVFAECPKGYTSEMFCDALLDKFGIVATPGNAFGEGGEGYFRLSALGGIETAQSFADKFDLP